MKKNKIKVRVNISNRKARYDYEFITTYLCGLSLLGSEVKAIKQFQQFTMSDSYCLFKDGELFLKDSHISAFAVGSTSSHEEKRERKLLLKKRELKKLQKDLIPGMSIIPVKLFENDKGLLKLEIALAKGKKSYDKRESIKKRDTERDVKRELSK